MGDIPKNAGPSASSTVAPAASLSAAIFESCSEAIIATSLAGVVIGWNSAAAQLAGYRADEVLGQHWRFLVGVDDVKEIARAVRRFQGGDKIFRLETHL